MNPKESYDKRKIIKLINSGNKNITDTYIDTGFFLDFNLFHNSYELRVIYDKNNVILTDAVIDAYKIKCSCEHTNYIDLNNSYVVSVPSLDMPDIISSEEEDNIKYVTDKINTLIEFIQDTAKYSDYIIINRKYNIGNNIINFACPICGTSFSLLPHTIDGFNRDLFYKYYDDRKYYSNYISGAYENSHFMYTLLEKIANNRIINIPNMTGILVLEDENISVFGDNRHSSFVESYISQNRELTI